MSAAERKVIAVPWRLLLRRAQYQIVPIATMLVCTVIVAWLWARNVRALTAIGEVNAVRVNVESKYDGLLIDPPVPVNVFDRVEQGQVIARLDTSIAEAQLKRLTAELESIQKSSPDSAVVRERQAQIAELNARLDARDIKAPLTGIVTIIHERPGQSAKLAKPILTIAAERGDFIIAYMRENQLLHAQPGMAVTIRARAPGGKTISFESRVDSVGAQVEQLPHRYWRKIDIAEFGLPVKVALPPESEFHPGENVDLIFHPNG
jgi:multidrug resistance efflux pump